MTEDEIMKLTLNELTDHWTKDAKVDYNAIGEESLKTSALHSKYLKILALHGAKHREALRARAKIRQLRQAYYDGSIDQDTEEKYGWKPFPYKVLRTDMEKFLEADDIVQKAEIRVSRHEDMVETCKAIIKEIGNRSYQFKASVDWQRLMAGFNA